MVYVQENAEASLGEFIKILEMHIESSTTKQKTNSRNRKRKEWITQGLVRSVNRKDELRKRVLNDPHNVNLEEEYKNYRNKLCSLIKTTKINYYKNLIDESQNDSKTLWEVVNLATNAKDCNNRVARLKNSIRDAVNDDIEMVQEFNRYFTEIGPKLTEAARADIAGRRERNGRLHESTMLTFPTDAMEVMKEISSLKNRRSPGYDLVTAKMLKGVHNVIAHPLAHIINQIIETGECPSHFKLSVVRPIYKKGDRENPSNYRPISLI